MKDAHRLRCLGYRVRAHARDVDWRPRRRMDKLEVARFNADFERAYSADCGVDVGARPFINALDRASADPSFCDLRRYSQTGCCCECHFAWEEAYVFPYLEAAQSLELMEKHRELLAGCTREELESHAEHEMDLYRDADVPPELMAYMDADHPRVLAHFDGEAAKAAEAAANEPRGLLRRLFGGIRRAN